MQNVTQDLDDKVEQWENGNAAVKRNDPYAWILAILSVKKFQKITNTIIYTSESYKKQIKLREY